MSAIFLAAMVFSVGAMDSAVCCMLRAHTLVEIYQDLPWIVCHDFDEDYKNVEYFRVSTNNATDQYYPSVNHTMGWCESTCSGYERSSVTEWFQPLATWILPTLATALLISVGEKKKAKKHWGKTMTGSNRSKRKSSGLQGSRLRRLGRKLDRFKPAINIMVEIPYIILRIPFFTPEFLIMLGDPASAIWGGFSELWMDTSMMRRLPKESNPLNRAMIGMAVLVGQTRFEDGTINQSTQGLVLQGLLSSIERMLSNLKGNGEMEHKKLEALRNVISPHENSHARGPPKWPSREKPPTRKDLQKVSRVLQSEATLQQTLITLKATLSSEDLGSRDEQSEVTSSSMKKAIQDVLEILPGIEQSFPDNENFPPPSDFTNRLEIGIKTILKARLDIVSGVLLPVALTLITTASAFHDAYTNLGDYESAYNLAFGVWYSWIIVLAVISNSYAASLNAGLTRETLGDVMNLSDVTVPLRYRHSNSIKWKSWMEDMGFITGEPNQKLYEWDWYLKYFAGQMTGWACVAFSSACAAAISYTTPTVGVDCRTFTFMLYGSISLLLALTMILRTWLRNHYADWRRARLFYYLFYRLFVTVNLFVLVGGTISHLAGFFRTCRCKRLFAHASSIVELNTGTRENYNNAKKFWLPVGYLAFTFVWIVMTIVLNLRAYIKFHLRRLFREKNRERVKHL